MYDDTVSKQRVLWSLQQRGVKSLHVCLCRALNLRLHSSVYSQTQIHNFISWVPKKVRVHKKNRKMAQKQRNLKGAAGPLLYCLHVNTFCYCCDEMNFKTSM